MSLGVTYATQGNRLELHTTFLLPGEYCVQYLLGCHVFGNILNPKNSGRSLRRPISRNCIRAKIGGFLPFFFSFVVKQSRRQLVSPKVRLYDFS